MIAFREGPHKCKYLHIDRNCQDYQDGAGAGGGEARKRGFYASSAYPALWVRLDVRLRALWTL
jgi:hypothetical protein